MLRDRLVRPDADPGLGGVAVAPVLQLLEEIAQAAVEDGPAGSTAKRAAENPPERAFQQIAQPASRAAVPPPLPPPPSAPPSPPPRLPAAIVPPDFGGAEPLRCMFFFA